MSTQTNDLFNNFVQGVTKAAETNLRLQQDLFVNWTRLWPGFTGRPTAPWDNMSQYWKQWSDNTLNAVQAQQELLSEQYGSAMDLVKSAVGIQGGEESPPAPETRQEPVGATPIAAPRKPDGSTQSSDVSGPTRNIAQKVAIVTGAASGIGEAVSRELANRGARAVLLVDRSDSAQELAASINGSLGRTVAVAKIGDTTDQAFRKRVFNEAAEEFGPVSICVPAAGITRDGLSVRINKDTGHAEIYPIETFRQVTEINLLAPIYWGIELVARIAEDRKQRGLGRWEPEESTQGAVIFLGSVSSLGNKGQISYAVAKAGLEGAAATLQKEAIFHGVRCGIIHPGFTDTPMARALGEDFLNKNVLPYTQLRRLIRPDEIADAICFMISNSAVSGELWADAGWHPPA